MSAAKVLTYKGRQVEIDSVETSGMSRDSVDAYVSEAHYADTGEQITDDEELSSLTELFPEVVYDLWFDNQIDAADDAMDRAKDREWDL